MAMQKMAHPAGELAVAGAAKRHNVPYVLSTFATTSIEDVAAVGASCLLQLYVFKMRNISLSLVRRAERAGFKGIILTLDAPRLGSRKRDHNNSFKLPSHLELANFSTLHFENTQAANTSMLQTQFDPQLETDLSVSTLKWLLANTTLPVWAKGILRPDDAQRAVTAGIAGIIVSNHGGRQLDGTISSISALPHVVRAVRGRVPVLFDSGVRTGEDVVRAIALGASAVLLGRPVLWALAGGGEEAVHQLLNTFRTDIELAMCLCGARYVSEITRDLVVLPGDDLCRQCGDMRAKL